MSLNKLKIGDRGKIIQIHSPELEMVLMKLGLVRGDQFRVTQQAPFNGPIAVQCNGTQVAIREQDARAIEVSLIHGKTP